MAWRGWEIDLFGRIRRQTEAARADVRRAEQDRRNILVTVLGDVGLTDFLTVLDSARTLFANQDALAQSQTAIVVDLIALYKALGGGWQ